jgi:hypothetical protein
MHEARLTAAGRDLATDRLLHLRSAIEKTSSGGDFSDSRT